MPYAFNLTLDPDASLSVERLYATLATEKIPDHDLVTQYGPCVTLLVVSDGIHEQDVAELLARHVPTMAALKVEFSEFCVIEGMPPVLSLRVRATDALLALHSALFDGVPERAVHPQYRPALWQPHLKLANIRGRKEGARLVRVLGEDWTALAGLLDHVEVIQYPPAQTIWQAPLKKAPDVETGQEG